MKWIIVFTVIAQLVVTNAKADIDLCRNNDSIVHIPMSNVTYGANLAFVPDPILIPLTIDMAKRYSLNITSGLNVETFAGMLEIYKDGRILYDGIDISGDISGVCENGASKFENIIEQQSKDSNYTN